MSDAPVPSPHEPDPPREEHAPSEAVLAVYDPGGDWTLPPDLVERVVAAASEAGVRLTPVRDRDGLLEALPDAEGLVGFPLTSEDAASGLEQLRWVLLVSASGDRIARMRGLADRKGLRVGPADPVAAVHRAEHAVMQTLSLLRALPATFSAERSGDDDADTVDGLADSIRSLADLDVAILGLGAVGSAIAVRLRTFGCRIRGAWPASADPPPAEVEHVAADSEIEDLLADSDVIIHAPPLAVVRGGRGLDADRLVHARGGSILVAPLRAEILDADAIVQALDDGRLAGAALDLAPDPGRRAATGRLRRRDDVLLTPRLAGVGPRYWTRAASALEDNFRRLAAGRPFIDEWRPADGGTPDAHART